MVSIIVPVYNVEKDLHRCVNSILSQDYADFELLLINDGSKDKSGAICDEFALKDCRVRVFHKENKGVSSARNLGLDNSKGEYILFVDGDDILNGDALSNYMKFAGMYDLIISEWGYLQHTGNTLYEKKADDKVYLGKEEIYENIIKLNGVHWSVVWNKLYKRNLLEKYRIRFNEKVTREEDLLFNWEYVQHIDKLKSISTVTYFYCGNPGSAVCRRHSFDSYNIKMRKMDEIFCNIQDNELRSNVRAAYFECDMKVCDSMYYCNVNRDIRLETLAWLKQKGLELNFEISDIKGRYNKIIFFALRYFNLRVADLIAKQILCFRNRKNNRL